MPGKFQAPKGTRNLYPDQMAWQRHLLDRWRAVSERNGFEQVDGPVFESLDLYKAKSGEGIVSELFHFTDRGDRELAIRPEFTPTLARMVAAKANTLPRPIKWYCTPNLCRAERPQRGRLREFLQWNCDVLASDSAVADAECILTAVDLLRSFGLTPQDVRVKISHRTTVRHLLSKLGVGDAEIPAALELLDRRAKIPADVFAEQAGRLGMTADAVAAFDGVAARALPLADGDAVGQLARTPGLALDEAEVADLHELDGAVGAFGVADWCELDLAIVRGLAYYTGTVFEIHEATGAERALAGGGRYDSLIEQLGGPPTPAVGFGMGDVVLTNLLTDKGLLPADVAAKPDAFVIAPDDAGAQHLPRVVAHLRARGLHVRFSYKTTRNLGKLLKEASACGAWHAVILNADGVERGCAGVKNLADQTQHDVPLADLAVHLGAASAKRDEADPPRKQT